jgi:hypothetical protein
MPSTFESVLRADDLLYCQFEFVNLALGSSATGAPQLTRAAAGPAFIVVRLPPQAIAEQVVPPPGPEPGLPFGAGLAGPSRLTFLVPDNVTPFRLDALLALMGRANLVIADDRRFWEDQTSAIENPDRLLLVPPASSRLIHRTGPVTSNRTGATEIWHTTLSDPATAGAWPRLRAISNPSDRADRPFATALKKADREDIVAHCGQNANISSSLLRLTALGATARLKSDWPPNLNITLAEWEHQTEAGRDRYVQTARQGYLFNFGHRAVVTTVTQRQIVSHFPLQTAELVQQIFLAILEPERSYEELSASYPGKGREMPFLRARIVKAPPKLEDPDAPIPVSLLLTDCAGSHINCDASVFFVTAENAADPRQLGPLSARYQTLPPVALGGQRVAITKSDPTLGDTSLNLESINFDTKLPSDLVGPAVPAFLPFMSTAQARIPALEQMVGTSANATPAKHRQATSIVFHESYLRAGFPLGDAKGVFAKFAPLASLAIPPERAGGLAAPKFAKIDGLSRLSGPVSGVDDFVNNKPLDPEALLGDAKLLGLIELKKVIRAVAGGADPFPVAQARELFDTIDSSTTFLPRPVITTVPTASGLETRFIWKPRISDTLPAILSKSSGMGLILKGRITAGAGSPTSPPAFSVQGKLTNFALSLLDLVTVKFDSVQFASQSGSKVDFKPHVSGVEFTGALAFVQKLQELLPTTSMSGAPEVQTMPDGVTVRYGIQIPSVPLGAMTIENLALSASVSLPFVEGKPAAVQFALSQRDNPFQISISIFGGTGFFSLQALTNNGLVVEGALEFGGIAELNLEVVKGGVHLLAGVYLSMGPPVHPALGSSPSSDGGLQIEGHLRLGGCVDVLGLVSVSIEFYLALTYKIDLNVLHGTGQLTVGIKLLFHSESFSFAIEREIAFGEAPGGGAPLPHPAFPVAAFAAAVRVPAITADQWERYCRAFA